MDVSDVIVMVKDLNGELTAADNDRIVRWINQERQFREIDSGHRGQSEHGLQAATLDVEKDEELVPLPTDFLALTDDGVQRLNDSGKYIVAKKKPRRVFREWDADSVTYGTDEHYYALRGNYLVLRPIPAAAASPGIRIDYYRYKDDWVSATALPSQWVPFVETLATGAALRSGIRYEDQRIELERHYDGRLVPHFNRNFQRRDQTKQRMTTGRASMLAARRGRFGRRR